MIMAHTRCYKLKTVFNTANVSKLSLNLLKKFFKRSSIGEHICCKDESQNIQKKLGITNKLINRLTNERLTRSQF